MPARRKGARLWLRPGYRHADGRERQASWIIIDGGRHIATGCLAGEAGRAEQQLSAYIASKYEPRRKERGLAEIDVADVLSIYFDDKAPADERPKRALSQHVRRLTLFWGGRSLAEVTGASCRDYVVARVKASPRKSGRRTGGARRDLEVLRAAIAYHAEQGFHRELVKVALPDKGDARDRWLTRSEAARLLWTCWRARETQTLHRGAGKGDQVRTARRPLRHLARFILVGIYTGTRAASIASASPHRANGRSFLDLDRGVFYRLPRGQAASNKRQPPAPIPPRLLAHIRRWVRVDQERAESNSRDAPTHLVEWNGKPIRSVKTGLASAVTAAKLGGDPVTPHTLRHTAATWLMQAGVDKWQAAGFLGMSVQTLDRVYGHHHTDHMREAAQRIGYRPQPEAQSLRQSLRGAGRLRLAT